jgi:hypothetical protein
MALRGKFEKELDRLWYARIDGLKRMLFRGRGRRRLFSKKIREDGIPPDDVVH